MPARSCCSRMYLGVHPLATASHVNLEAKLLQCNRHRKTGRVSKRCKLPSTVCHSTAVNNGPAHPDESSTQSRKRQKVAGGAQKRGPLDDTYIRQLILNERGHLARAGVAMVFAVACNVASPVVAGTLLGLLTGSLQGGPEVYGKWFSLMASLYIVEPILTRIYITNLCTLAEKVLANLRKELFRSLLLQKVQFFDVHSASALTSLISSELDSVRSFVFRNVSRDRGPRAILEAIGAVIVLFALSWRLGPILATVIIGTAITVNVYKDQTKGVERTNAAATNDMNTVANQTFESITTVRSFAGESLERERFGEFVETARACGLQFGKAKGNLESLSRGAVHLSLLGLYGYGGWLVNQGLMAFRVLASAIGFTFSLIGATQGILNTTVEFQRMQGSVRRIQEILSKSEVDESMAGALPPGAWWEYATSGTTPPPAEPYGINAGNAAVLAAKAGPLELKNINFTYPLRKDRPVLTNLNLTLPKGSVTALVGRSGAGKSTVAALLSRFYAPDDGDLLLDGKPAGSFTRGEWARAISIVQQEPVLFGGTIGDNIAYGKYGRCSQEQIEAAARAAHAHEFIEQLPEGYATDIGGRGMLLSGGQRQRIALARALIKDSPIILLDEATSALDAVSEKLVQQAIDKLTKDKTVLVIAHRLSTVQAAEQIIVLDKGRVAETGSHDQLVERKGLYSDLVSSQSLSLSLSV